MATKTTRSTHKIAPRSPVEAWPHPLYAGSVHYFRTPVSNWRDVLLGLKDMGLFFVDTYVPWAVHEPTQGAYDFGQTDPRKNLRAFVELAEDLELGVILRPGPHINAELTRFGLPQYILEDADNWALGPSGNPVPLPAPPVAFPVPSHSSPTFVQASKRWYTAVADHLRPVLRAGGPIQIVQVDNEAAFYFRDAPYDQDYSPGSLADNSRFLKKSYKTLAALNAAHGTEVSKWRDAEPPRKFDATTKSTLIRHLDWAECQDNGILSALTGFARALRECGLAGEALLSHNIPMGNALLPVGPGALQKIVDLPGSDFYERRQELRTVKERTLRLAGNAAHPFAAELGIGGPPWLAPRTDGDTLAVLLCGLAYGLRGFNLYMAADRDRWYGSALNRHGEPTPVGTRLARLIHCLSELHFHRLKRKAEVAIVMPTLYRRMSRITHTLGALSPAVSEVIGIGAAACRQDTFGMEYPIQQHWLAWIRGAMQLLDAAQVPYTIVDSEAPPARLSEIRALICPTYEMVDSGAWELVQQFSQDPNRLALFGPEAPTTDGRLHALSQTGAQPEDLLDLTLPNDRNRAVAALAELNLYKPGFDVLAGQVERSVHESDGAAEVLFLTNFNNAPEDATVQLPHSARLVDMLTGDSFGGEVDVTVAMKAESCRALRIHLGRQADGPPATQETTGVQ